MKVGNSWLLCSGLPQFKAESLAASQNPQSQGTQDLKGPHEENLRFTAQISLVNHQVFDTNLLYPTAGMWGLGFPTGDPDLCGRTARKSQV